MLIKRPEDIRSSEITPETTYLSRREFVKRMAAAGLVTLGGTGSLAAATTPDTPPLSNISKTSYGKDLHPTDAGYVTTYNNFYEFGTGKDEPAVNAHTLRPRPWSIKVSGECEAPGQYDFEDILKNHPLEERIYRFRCVEAWSMVVPWVGFPLGDMLKRFKPTSRAKYVEFTTLHDPVQMPGQRRAVLEWPYVEGLRIDEAMHPLALMAVGLYGRVLPNQNGAPIRLVVPWKYGFKNIKSIVAIRFTDQMPVSSWMKAASQEYGFYANVNPTVDHPRWSQARERVLGASFLSPRQDTLMFNGYTEQVASLYQGMDLRRYY